jgi:hypothetical protein
MTKLVTTLVPGLLGKVYWLSYCIPERNTTMASLFHLINHAFLTAAIGFIPHKACGLWMCSSRFNFDFFLYSYWVLLFMIRILFTLLILLTFTTTFTVMI